MEILAKFKNRIWLRNRNKNNAYLEDLNIVVEKVNEVIETPVISVWEKGSGTLSVQTVGTGCIASGQYSVAEGKGAVASGTASHSEGDSTQASGEASHTEGNSTQASGTASHSEGNATTASGEASHAEGVNTVAIGYASHAEGENSIASGAYSHAQGVGCTASGDNSHASGWFTVAQDYAEITGGRFNVVGTGDTQSWVETDNLLTLGNGASAGAPSNAFQVKKNGDVSFAGILTGDGSGLTNIPTLETSYKIYRALLTQTGIENPIPIILENTLDGIPVWTRFEPGAFKCTLEGAFTINKRGILLGPCSNVLLGPNGIITEYTDYPRSENEISLLQSNMTTSVATDNLDNLYICIIVNN